MLSSAVSQLNNSNSGLFTVFTGVKDFSRIHLVDKWNGLSKVRAEPWPPRLRPEPGHLPPLRTHGRGWAACARTLGAGAFTCGQGSASSSPDGWLGDGNYLLSSCCMLGTGFFLSFAS